MTFYLHFQLCHVLIGSVPASCLHVSGFEFHVDAAGVVDVPVRRKYSSLLFKEIHITIPVQLPEEGIRQVVNKLDGFPGAFHFRP